MKEKLLLLCFILACSFSSYGQSGQSGNISWSISDSVLTISGAGDMPDYVAYQQPWYPYRYNIVSVVIGDSITSLGKYAFWGCGELTKAEISCSVNSIGYEAFSDCRKLANIEIPNSVTSIGVGAFSGCESLTSIKIPDGVTKIEGAAFKSCTSLTSINIPDGVTSIGSNAFAGCNFTNIDMPNSVTSIGHLAFNNCRSLVNIRLSDNLTHIGPQTFSSCHSLTSIKIPNGITIIEEETFFGCTNLVHVEIPNSVTSIRTGAFGVRNLKLVDVYWDEPLLISSGMLYGSSNAVLVVPEGTKALYEAAPVWQNFGTIIERPIAESVSIYASLLVGSSLLLEAEIIPSNTIYQDVTWSSSDVAVATVDATGKVTGVSPGIATVTVTTAIGGKTASFKVKVKEEVMITRSDEATNNQTIQNNINVSLIDGTLTVNTPDKETIRVYGMTGALLFSAEKSEGKQTYFIPNLSKEIYVVVGNSGWNAKVRNN